MKFYKFNHQVGTYFKIGKFKAVEASLHYRLHLYFTISFSIMTKCDHSPIITFDLQIFGVGLEVNFYDTRHIEEPLNAA